MGYYIEALLTNLKGASARFKVSTSFACITLSCHSFLLSPSFNIGSTLKSRRRRVRKQTASVVANFRPMHARGPDVVQAEGQLKNKFQRKPAYQY
jgi:hypothetical protein